MKIDTSYLTNLSPSWRLSLLLAAGSLAASLLAVAFGVRPDQKRLAALREEADQFQTARTVMESDIRQTDKLKQQVDAVLAERDAILARGALEPLLGSFAMRGKSLLDPVAAETGFTIETVKELPLIPLQLPVPPPEQTYGRQPVEFTGRGSYAQIAAFVKRAEADQPLATLSSLLILAQQQSPETHKAVIAFEWPAKGEKLAPPPAKK